MRVLEVKLCVHSLALSATFEAFPHGPTKHLRILNGFINNLLHKQILLGCSRIAEDFKNCPRVGCFLVVLLFGRAGFLAPCGFQLHHIIALLFYFLQLAMKITYYIPPITHYLLLTTLNDIALCYTSLVHG